MSTAIATSGNGVLGTLGSNGYVQEGVPFENPIDPVAVKKNRFLRAEKWVSKRRSETSEVPITYSQEGNLISLCATPGKTIFRYTDDHGMSQRKQSRDYLISVSDAVINDVLIRPKDGDIIVEETLLERYTYEVGAFNGEPHFRFSGTYRQTFRVHTKLVNREDI